MQLKSHLQWKLHAMQWGLKSDKFKCFMYLSKVIPEISPQDSHIQPCGTKISSLWRKNMCSTCTCSCLQVNLVKYMPTLAYIYLNYSYTITLVWVQCGEVLHMCVGKYYIRVQCLVILHTHQNNDILYPSQCKTNSTKWPGKPQEANHVYQIEW